MTCNAANVTISDAKITENQEAPEIVRLISGAHSVDHWYPPPECLRLVKRTVTPLVPSGSDVMVTSLP